ncbi:MAG TPA: molybdenum cofactor guanylyltransferase [Methanosarcinales archaeon]|nr:molybdenum cofactor guanylyltransferase [Methanosarcinales archaeon]
MRTGIILCGGRSRRFGKDKALLSIDGVPMVQRMTGRISHVVDKIIIAARDSAQRESLAAISAIPDGAEVVCDPVIGYGPVAGILAGLSASKSEYSICLACDLPYVNPEVIDALFGCAEANNSDVAIPKHPNGMLEPLHAVYGRSMVGACRDAIDRGGHTIRGAMSSLERVIFVPTESLRRFDPDLRTFLNVNYPEDLGVRM